MTLDDDKNLSERFAQIDRDLETIRKYGPRRYSTTLSLAHRRSLNVLL